MAGQRLRRERADHTLEPAALANEVWLKLVRTAKGFEWKDSHHFFAACGRIMRNILIDHARRQQGEKISLEFVAGISINEGTAADLLALDSALERLGRFDPRGAKVLELITFAGFTQKEVAETLGISERTVKRDYAACRVWLREELRRGSNSSQIRIQKHFPAATTQRAIAADSGEFAAFLHTDSLS